MPSSPSITPLAIPRRTRGQGRTTVVPVRLLPADRDRIQAYAERHGSTVSTVLSALGGQLAQGGGSLVALAEPSPELRELTMALSRIANSLNQLAKRANQGGLVRGDGVADLAEEARNIVLHLRAEVLPWV